MTMAELYQRIGEVVGKHMGYSHMAAPHAKALERFHEEYVNPY